MVHEEGGGGKICATIGRDKGYSIQILVSAYRMSRSGLMKKILKLRLEAKRDHDLLFLANRAMPRGYGLNVQYHERDL